MSETKICDKFCFKSRVFVENGNGELISMKNNLVVQTGLDLFAKNLEGDVSKIAQYIALGTGGAAPTLGDTALMGEVSPRKIATVTRAANILTFEATFLPGEATAIILEAGLLDSISGGVLVARANTGSYDKQALDTITVRWEITLG
ncbi:MAG: hypothetical protein DRO67_05960 [Candidatus Asgardarchaeum californiense]|nr:MAG: hypothetical protein DRO67_05960 [Candidatus Asgardarchaeum californiense]